MKPEAARKHHIKVKNPDGSFSSERTITVGMGNRHVNIPTMIRGKQLTDRQAVRAAKEVGIKRFPSFDTEKKAVAAAKRRSDRLGGKRIKVR
jgi:hypothetical protein